MIAEHKRRSPSAGVIREDLALEDVVGAYERGGAAALSVLTEEHSFGGSLADLELARRSAALPILRKDFVVDRYQLAEARGGRRRRDPADRRRARRRSPARAVRGGERGSGSTCSSRSTTGPSSRRAAALRAPVIGINNRDLTTLEVDTERTFELLPGVPDGTVVVAESGFRTRAELERLAGAGVDAVLVGEALMRAPDIEAACAELTGRGR